MITLGCPIDNPLHSSKIQQKNGNTYKMSQILQDNYVMDQIAHLDRERIPERSISIHPTWAQSRG